MRRTALSALGLVAVLTAPAVAVGTPGPFAGVVAQGETRSHLYDNNPTRADCIQLVVPYTVALTYAPPTDTLTLDVGLASVTGVNGSARLSFYGSYCTSFPIGVRGTSVGVRAAYVVSVSTGPDGSR